ncbi:hypothetical protein PR048_033326 [Dryococelus australis]|uniref:Uncharacterized protein n=1 Tax=Dryococelus australis TaxID=614101 RepID=A0ABQ9FZZ2_9NEOP|nr:hypothetical protein PR048_033326 [Dryococelus australis]
MRVIDASNSRGTIYKEAIAVIAGPERKELQGDSHASWEWALKVIRGRGGVVVRLLVSYLDEPGSIPAGIAPVYGNRAERCRWSVGFLGISRLSGSFVPALLLTHLASPKSNGFSLGQARQRSNFSLMWYTFYSGNNTVDYNKTTRWVAKPRLLEALQEMLSAGRRSQLFPVRRRDDKEGRPPGEERGLMAASTRVGSYDGSAFFTELK